MKEQVWGLNTKGKGFYMRGIVQPDGRPLCGSELWFYFSPFVDQSIPN